MTARHLKMMSSLPPIPPFALMIEAQMQGKRLAMKTKVKIFDQQNHDLWADRWLTARWKWWARYCHRKMKSYVHNTVEWRIVD